MKAPARLGIYGLLLVAVFAAAFLTARAVVPDDVVENWSTSTQHADGEHQEDADQ